MTKKSPIKRDLFMAILRSSITRRDAKTYLSQFDQSKGRKSKVKPDLEQKTKVASSNHLENWERNFAENFNTYKTHGTIIPATPSVLIEPRRSQVYRIIIIRLTICNTSDEKMFENVASSLSHAILLGIRSVVVVDYADDSNIQLRNSFVENQNRLAGQLNRLTRAISRQHTCESIVLNDALTIQPVDRLSPKFIHDKGKIILDQNNLIKSAMKDGKICVVAPIAFSSRSMSLRQVSANDVVIAISDSLSSTDINEEDKQYSVERIILIDPLGGIPISRESASADEFINLEEEYTDIIQELKERVSNDIDATDCRRDIDNQKLKKHNLVNYSSLKIRRHIRNLELIRNSLNMLPTTSSALIASPTFISAAFSRSLEEEEVMKANHGGTALVHNFLTNKPPLSIDRPLLSPSGPEVGLRAGALDHSTHSSFIRRGNKLKVFPRPKQHGWSFALVTPSRLKPLSSVVCLERIRHLLEDSFGRSLNMGRYFGRIQHSLAGIVIAGDYLGCAILTWEKVGKSRSTQESRPKASDKPVPYLDKFAVVKHCQGEGGLAGTMFSAIKNEVFGSGFVWRSRKNNIVNKWYFGRSVGTWKLPNSEWTMFWTTSDIERDTFSWQSYVQVCIRTKSSWEI